MPPITVHIKHAGKVHDVHLDPDLPATLFKEAIYQKTGVPPERMKVMIKGGMLKDDTDWRKVAPKEGQTFMVIGAAGELPKPPSTPVVFLEDMDESELAQALALPVGLENLGNTCYMNATLQALRAIPELQSALTKSSPSGIAGSLNGLYSTMSKTTEPVTPLTFLSALRLAFPQFAEMSSSGPGGKRGYAQQDAEECWVQVTNALKDVPGLPGPSSETPAKKFVEQYMMGEMRTVIKCDDPAAADEPPTITRDDALKISCNITINTNYMHTGIKDSLDSKIEKTSPTLGREAVYSSTSRLSRLPSYLTVHMVRFAWRRDIEKKAKIMRRVKFPLEFDAVEIVTDELKEKLLPVSRRLMDIERDRAERKKIRKRSKEAKPVQSNKDVEMADANTEPSATTSEAASTTAAGGALEDESVYREKELKELEALVHPDLKADVGCSVTGLYELVAIVTHKGAAADAGHYMAYVKKSVFHPVSYTNADTKTATGSLEEDDEDWYKFDDSKVSVFPKEKIPSLEGGGEDSAAYVLLYKSKSLA